jgi:uncharacterized protein (DUF1778 family)
MARAKEARLEARLTREQDALLREAATSRGMPLSAFVLDAALERAQQVRGHDLVTVVPAEQRAAFAAWLEEPAEHVPDMKRLAEAEPLENR